MASWQEQVAEAHAEVINEIRSKFKDFKNGPSILEGVKAFCAAEPWILSILVLQAIIFLTAVSSRKNPALQAFLFFLAMSLVYLAERINALAAVHWESFSRQNYFQDQGLFTSALLSAPLLLTMFVILINYLIEMGVLMVDMKRKELQYKARAQQRQEKTQAGAEEPKKTK